MHSRHYLREDEENNLPQITIQTGRLFFSSSLTILFIFCCCFHANAQQAIQQKINKKFAATTNASTYAPLIEVEANNLKSSIPEAVLPQKQFFQIQAQQFQSIKENKSEQLLISLPIEGQQVEFQLIKAEIFSDDFQAVAASGVPLSQDMGVHYWGTVADDANSLATFSFIGSELVGGIYADGKQYTLGKLKNSDTHILYNNAELKNDTEYECQELLPPGATDVIPPINPQPLSAAANCVRIHMEVDHSVYLSANSDATLATNYITGLFAQVAALYADESITVQISYLQLWDTPSPYGNGTELDDLVAQNYGKTNGDLVHVIHTNGLRGLAYRGVICNNFVNAGASGIQGSYNAIPTFSWDAEVVTHEIGHNLGSPHTHGCYWNGNNTAIDGCGPEAGYSEGCDANLPTVGTIMSYCHLVSGVGIDFNLGFGQQPGDLVRSAVNSAFCLTECSVTCPNGNPGDTCDDGDVCTTNDVLDDNCECAGTLADADQDGVCDADDICEFGDDNLDTDGDNIPDACDFSNGSMDTDQDGVPDDEDICPGFDDNLIGTSCDDGDLCTSNDTYTQDCECAGTLIDVDNNGVCDADESEAAYDLSFSVAEVDCQNQTISVDFAVKASNANSGFDIADQNYRMSFDRNIENPVILQELGMSGIYPLANSEFALFSPHSLLGSMDTVVSYNIALQTNAGFPLTTTPVPVGRIGFDIVDDSGCFDIKWHTPDIYPPTVIIEENDGSLIPINTGSFSDITICLDDYCPACEVGATCDDGDICTTNDTITEDCECEGQLADADGDGICDAFDICPDFNDELIGTLCDDGDPCTVGDFYTANCECAGTYFDTDEDGVCDEEDVCVQFDDTLIGTSCDDNNDCTVDDIYTDNCECEGTPTDSDQDGVCDAEDICPEFDDTLIGTPCDDGDICTIQDIYTENCECEGTYLDTDEDGVCDEEDVCPQFDDALIGTLCDDGDDCTVNDTYTEDCECAGILLDSDNDGLCDEEDPCPGFDDALLGTSCDDGDDCTVNDVYTANCECAGTYADSDEDGVCDEEDVCPQFDDALIGTSCDDGDDCTVDDTYTDDCECVGTFLDADEDGFCDAEDICPDFNDELIGTLCDDGDACTVGDFYTENCECEGTYFDTDEDGVCDEEDVCPQFDDALIGTSCDDGDDCTVDDVYTEDCECAGIFLDSDEDGFCDAEDICPEFDDTLIGTPCDDGDACTVQDVYTENCECAGTYADSDDDGVCDEEDVCPQFDDALIGTSCDDGDDCTVDDTYTDDCECVGTFLDADEDGFCDAEDICPDFNDELIGTPCDDNNECTVEDIYTENCECVGTYLDSDEDGICNPLDDCPNFNNTLIGTPCDDGDACTAGDIYTPNCECAGVFADTDNDGVCDEDDICEFGDDNLDDDGDGIPNACDYFLDSDGDGVPDSEDICPGGDDTVDVDGNGTPDDCDDCPTINFNDFPVGTYGNSQDRGTVTTSDDGTTIELNNNAWKSIVVNYEVTPYTVVEFDFKSTQIGEIHGVGFDNNTSISSGYTFKVYGTQNWGNPAFNNYTGSGEYEHFVIPVGEYYTGEAEYFFFVTDHDSQPRDGNSFFTNLKIYEDANEDGLCDNPDDCADADQDGVCDDDDVCPDGDDTLDTDEDGTPDYCDICPEDADNACDSAPDYCESSGSNTTYEYIDRVVFGNIDNTSGDNGGYGDFTYQVANIGLGDVVPLGLTPGFTEAAYNEGWKVWIDFNKDGDFNDDGERIFRDNGAGSLSGNIEIPEDAALGLTGMRVSMRWNRYSNACSDFTYGEVEDYTVNITAESQDYPLLDLRGEDYLVESPAMRVFPNPATDLITVNFQNIRDGGSVAIYSTSGQLIGTHQITSEHLQLPVYKLPAGVYILHLNFGDGNYATERFVKLSE